MASAATWPVAIPTNVSPLDTKKADNYHGEQKANIAMASLPLLPVLEEPKLVGIARLAAEGESLRQGHDVEYFALGVRSLLNRCTSQRMPFTWTINPYRGCEFACKYCYARYTHEFMEMRDGVDFERKVFVKQHTAGLLGRELRKVKAGEEIAIGTATDPYQPAERRYEVTRGILEELARHGGLDLGIVTKSNLILRDVEVLKEVSARNRLSVSITITTLNADLARILEPRAPRPDLRVETVRRLNEAGITTGVACAPVLPGITDGPRQLEGIVRATAEARGKHIFVNPLFLKPCSAAMFLPFLEKEFPQLVESYRQRFQSRAFLPQGYRKRISQLMARLKWKYGIVTSYQRGESQAAAVEEQQLALFQDRFLTAEGAEMSRRGREEKAFRILRRLAVRRSGC
jgi:DNA repair photolyase